MSITDTLGRQDLIRWAQSVRDLLQRRGDATAVAEIDRATEQYRADRFQIAVLGKAKRGKSTLLNAMLGRKDDLVAPIDKLPASSAITRFSWAAAPSATVFFRDGHSQHIDYEQIRQFVTEEGNPGNAKGVDIMEVTGPFPGLDRDLVLVDTPGAGSIHEHHDAILQAFIPQADAVIFLVTARMPLDQDELELLKNVKAADIRRVFFVVNRVDESNEQDIQAAIEHNQRLLAQAGIHVDRIHRISAKNAFKGMATSGVPELLGEIGRFLAENKGKVLNARLVSRVRQTAEPAMNGLAVELASSSKTVEELDADLRSLRNSKRTIEQERGLTEREFKLAWEKATDHFEHEVKEARNESKAVILNHVSRASLTSLRTITKELPTFMAKTIEGNLAAPAQKLEDAMGAASRSLQASYPVIEVKSAGEISVRTRAGHTIVVGGLGGAAAVATGIGLVGAGSAVAASIAAANAAALAAASTAAAAPTALAAIGSLGSFLGGLGVPYVGALGSLLGAAGTGTAAAAAPAALTTVPLWVALAGPVGWTLTGLGVLVVPFAWRASKLKQKDHLEEACREQVDQVFQRIQAERIPALRRMGGTILEDFRLRLDRQLGQIEASITNSRDNRPDPQGVSALQQLYKSLQQILAAAPQAEAPTVR